MHVYETSTYVYEMYLIYKDESKVSQNFWMC